MSAELQDVSTLVGHHGPGVPRPTAVKSFVLVLVLVFLPLSGVVLVLLYQVSVNEREMHARDGVHLTSQQTEIISREFWSIGSDLLYLSQQALLLDYLSHDERAQRKLAEEYLLFCAKRRVYDQVRYLDENGAEKLRINYREGHPNIVSDEDLQSKSHRYYFSDTIRRERGAIFVSPFDLNIEHGAIERPLKPVIRFATPVFDRLNQKRGIIVLNYLGAKLLRELGQASANSDGHMMIVSKDGFWVRGVNVEDDWGPLLGKDRTFADSFPAAWELISKQDDGQFTNASGLFTFQTLRAELATQENAGHVQARTNAGADSDSPSDRLFSVVSHVPPDVLKSRSHRFLRRVLLIYVVLLGPLLLLARYVAQARLARRLNEDKLRDSEARLRLLTTQLINAQEAERRSISRDLHDDLGQLITAININLKRAVNAKDGAKKGDMVALALHGTQRLLDRVQELSSRFRPAMLDDLGLKDAIQSHLAEYETDTGIITHADLEFGCADIPAVVSENVFRILQEALTNVSKHAHAEEVFVHVKATDSEVALMVRDHGVGMRPEGGKRRSLGIMGMRERVELLGGRFELSSEPSEGTQVGVSIPFGPSIESQD